MEYVDDSSITNAIVNIKVVGVGGGGNNVLLRIAEDRMPGIELLGINSDMKQLSRLQAAGIPTLPIGGAITRGRGAGGVMDVGMQAAVADQMAIAKSMRDADLVFITAGLGSGIGTGAAPVVAQIAHSMGILTVGVVTAPFSFEGQRKMRTANEGIARLKTSLDGLIVVHNDNLMKIEGNRRMTFVDSFRAADNVLRQAILGISELILTTGVVNVDFADVTSIFRQSESSDAIIGIGANDNGNAVEAVKAAVESPLIERSLDGARGILINITGGETLSLYAVSEASEFIYDHTHPNVNIIFGTVIDKRLGEKVRATIVATDCADSVLVREKQEASPNAIGRAPEPRVTEKPAAGGATENGTPAMSNAQLASVLSGAETVEPEQDDDDDDSVDIPDFMSKENSPNARNGAPFPWKFPRWNDK